MKTLQNIRERVVEIIGEPDLLPSINTRLVLRTGVALGGNGALHSVDDLSRVIRALEDMGYAVNGEKTLQGNRK